MGWKFWNQKSDLENTINNLEASLMSSTTRIPLERSIAVFKKWEKQGILKLVESNVKFRVEEFAFMFMFEGFCVLPASTRSPAGINLVRLVMPGFPPRIRCIVTVREISYLPKICRMLVAQRLAWPDGWRNGSA